MRVTSAKAKAAIFQVRKVTQWNSSLPMDLLWHIFDVSIAPIVLYGSEVWGSFARDKLLDQVDAKYAKQILGLPRGCPYAPIALESNRILSVFWKARLRPVTYWLRILKMQNDRLVKKAYLVQRNLHKEGVKCWASGVVEVLSDCGHLDKWEEDRVLYYSPFKRALEERMTLHAKEEWKIECSLKPSLTSYCEHGFDAPSLMNRSHAYRRALLVARCNLPTLVERVTHEGDRFWRCKLCSKLTDENWLHVLRDCEGTVELRNSYTSVSTHVASKSQCTSILYENSDDLAKMLVDIIHKTARKQGGESPNIH